MGTRIIGTTTIDLYEEYCDGCQGVLSVDHQRQESATVSFAFGYFSSMDGCKNTYVLCDECGEQLHQVMQKMFPRLPNLMNVFNYEDIPD